MKEIEIFKVDKSNVKAFMHLLPEGYEKELNESGQYALGCVYRNDADSTDNEDDMGVVAGVLCFFKQKRNIVIRHLLVKKECRQKGIARALLKSLYDFAVDSGVISIEMLIPQTGDEENNSLLVLIDEFTAYVPDWSNDFITTLGELKRVTIGSGNYRGRICPLSQVSDHTFTRFVRSISYDRKTGRQCEISSSRDYYDMDVSMVEYRKNAIDGVLLIKKGINNIFHPILLYVRDKKTIKSIPDMINRSISAASEKYDDDTYIYFGGYREELSALYEKLFSDLDVIPVIRYRLNV